MTLLARDEADIVESWLVYHLNAGADFVIATDNSSEDGTTEILESYAREGYVHLIRERGEGLRQDVWVTKMARLAAADFAADWVINSDADEFWWPRGPSLGDMLAGIPDRYGTVSAFLRSFVPRPEADAFFAERMTVRFSPLAPIHDTNSLFRPIRKTVHRADPNVTVAHGNHAISSRSSSPLRGWYPIEIFHFPLRTLEQCTRKTIRHEANVVNSGKERTGYHARMFDAFRDGRIEEYYESVVVHDAELERGRAEGRLIVDTRLRDALRRLRAPDAPGGGRFRSPAEAEPLSFPTPTLVEDAEYAVEAAALGEADVVRLQRRLDTLEQRLASLELRLPNRVYRRTSRAVKGVLRRGQGSSPL